jgi:hypothetical protein
MSWTVVYLDRMVDSDQGPDPDVQESDHGELMESLNRKTQVKLTKPERGERPVEGWEFPRDTSVPWFRTLLAPGRAGKSV